MTCTAVLESAQRGGRPLHLTAHSEGSVIATEAMRYLHNRSGLALDQIGMTFHGGATHAGMAQRIMQNSGAHLIGGYRGTGFMDHPYDLVPQIIGLRGWNKPRHVAGSLLYSPGLFMSEEYSRHTLPANMLMDLDAYP